MIEAAAYNSLAFVHFLARDYEKASEQALTALELEPRFYLARFWRPAGEREFLPHPGGHRQSETHADVPLPGG